MYKVIDNTQENLLAVKVSNKLTSKDFKKLVPQLERCVRSKGSVRFLCDMSEIKNDDFRSFWDDFKFSTKHISEFERMAVIGDQKWLQWWTNMSMPFFKTQLKCFDHQEAANAWNWLKEA